MKSSIFGMAVLALAGGVLIAATGCGPKPKKLPPPPTINLDSLRAVEEAKRRADSLATVEAKRRADEEARRKAEAEAAARRAEQEAKDKASVKVIYFDFDKYNIRTDMTTDCQSNAALMKKFEGWKVQLEGHADERGTNEYNLALGDRRSQSVKKFLIDWGIAADRISNISYGEERPAMRGTGEAVWSKNRRVEFNFR